MLQQKHLTREQLTAIEDAAGPIARTAFHKTPPIHPSDLCGCLLNLRYLSLYSTICGYRNYFWPPGLSPVTFQDALLLYLLLTLP